MKNWTKEGYFYKRAGFTITPGRGFFTMIFTNSFGHEVTVKTKTGFEKDLNDLMAYGDELLKLKSDAL